MAQLRSRIAMYLHGQAGDTQGRALLENTEQLLARLEMVLRELPSIPRQLEDERTTEHSSAVGERE